MSSIDIRVVKNMENDYKLNTMFKKKQFFSDKYPQHDMSLNDGIDILTYLHKIRRISMNRLNQSATIIQRFWRNKTKDTIVSYYSSLFRNITSIQHNMPDLS